MIVVDCAALVDALTAPHATEALRAVLAGQELHAPALVDVRVRVSAARARGSRLDQRGPSAGRAHRFGDLAIERWPAGDRLRRRAFDLRDSLTAYDAAYVALAENLRCPLVTRDERLARSTGHSAQIVVR